MIDGFKTSSLALDVHQLANKLGVDISPKAVSGCLMDSPSSLMTM